MKFRSTLLLFLVAAGIFAYVWFVENKRPSSREVLERGGRVTQFDRDKVTSISIKNSETKIELRKKDNGAWYLEEPVKDRADMSVLNQLFTTAESLKHDAVIGEGEKGASKDQIKDFGLANSDTRIKLTGDEKPVELAIGKDAAVEGKVYAKLEGSGTVYVIANDLKNQLAKKPDDFRDRKLTEVSTGQINKAVIKSSSGELELEKKNEHWSLVKPLKARGDDGKISDLLSQATTAHIEAFIADSANLGTFGLQEPRGTISLSVAEAKDAVVLQIGGNPKEEKDKEKTYAKISTRDAVVSLPKSIERLLATQPNDLRDKNLVRIESDIVDRMTIESPGEEKIVLARKGEDWVRKADKDLPANGAAATNLLNTLKAQQVSAFVADVATELPKYGLDQPQVKLTLSSFASENTAEEKAGEKPIVSLLFGKVDGENVYVKLDDEPFILSVNKSLLELIPANAIRWQELTIFKFKPEEITAIEITKADHAPIALEREKERWKLAKGDGAVNQVNAQSLVNTLAGLHAVRWLGATKSEDGFDKPRVLVTFKTATSSGKLMLGSATPDEMTRAASEQVPGTFVMSQPDQGVFDLPLVESPAAAAPPPSPAPTPQSPVGGGVPQPVPTPVESAKP